MVDFFKRNKVNFIVVFIGWLLIYGFRIAFDVVSIDTEILITNPDEMLNSWISIGRFGLVFIKRFFDLIPINIKLTNILSFITFFLSIVIWNLNLEKWQKNPTTFSKIAFGLILASSQVIIEQFGFTLQEFEVSLAFLIFAIAIYVQQLYFSKKKIVYLIFEIPLLAITFSCYQAFVILYITICVFDFIVKYDKKIDYKLIIKYISIFLISFFLYSLLNKIVMNYYNLNDSSYLQNQILWGKESILVVLRKIVLSIGVIVCGARIGENLGFLLSFICFMVYIVKNKKIKENKLFYLICIFFFITPFLTILYKGNFELLRARFSLVFLIALVSFYLLNNVKTIKLKRIIYICVIYIITIQSITSILLLTSDYRRYKEDCRISEEMYEIQKNTGKKLVFIGKYTSKDSFLQGETLGKSFFGWDAKIDFGVNRRVNTFMKILGYDYELPSQDEVYQAKDIVEKNNIKSWPDKDSVFETDNYVIINFEPVK